MADARESTFAFASDDGLDIAVQCWLPQKSPHAVVQISHGMGEHGLRYAGLAATLVAQGYAVYANDHRGHGRSIDGSHPLGHMGEHDTFTRAVGDVARLSARIAEEHAGLPRILFGHSMGGYIVQRVMWQHPEAAMLIALSGCGGRPNAIAAAGRGIARLERLRLGKDGQSALIDKLSFRDFNSKFRPNRTAFDFLSRDEAEVDRYVQDPLCGTIASLQTWIDLLDALPGLTDGDKLLSLRKDLPIYVFGGSEDPAVGPKGAGLRTLVDSYRAAWLSAVELKVYPEGRHEMLHELNRDEVTKDLLDWLQRALQGRAGAAA